MVSFVHTCVDLIAFLWAHRGNTGLSSIFLLAFSPDGTEGGGVAQGGEGGLNCREQVQKANLAKCDCHSSFYCINKLWADQTKNTTKTE